MSVNVIIRIFGAYESRAIYVPRMFGGREGSTVISFECITVLNTIAIQYPRSHLLGIGLDFFNFSHKLRTYF